MNLKFVVVLLLYFANAALAQTPVLYSENDDINRRLEKLEIENAIKDAQAESIPQVTVTPPNESVSVDDDSGYFSSVLTFEALRHAASAVECKLRDFKGQSTESGITIVSGAPPVEYAELYQITLANSKRLNGQMCKFVSATINPTRVVIPVGDRTGDNWSCTDGGQKIMALPIAAIPGLIGFAAQLVSFANIERKIHGVSTKVTSGAVEIAMQEALISNYWSLESLQFEKFDPDAEGGKGNGIIDKLKQMIMNSSALAEKQIELKKQMLSWTQNQNELSENVAYEKEILKIFMNKEDADADIRAQTEKISKAQLDLSNVKTKLQFGSETALEMSTIQGTVTTLINNLLSKGENNNSLSLLHQFALIDLYNDVALGLEINLENNGGEMHTTDSIWTHAKISYLGGVTLSYRLVDFSEGKILATGMVTKVLGETIKAKKLSSQLEPNRTALLCDN